MATRLAAAGVLTVVMHYSLFPRARVPEMVDEVSAALSWTLEHCSALGGDPARVRWPAAAEICSQAAAHATRLILGCDQMQPGFDKAGLATILRRH